MGLDTTHDAWHGAYSSFKYFRDALLEASGLDIDYSQYEEKNVSGDWDILPDDPLIPFFVHSDCDGYIPVEVMSGMADRLMELYPLVDEDWQERIIQFVNGLRKANEAGEVIEFR